jgi:glycosyltransferase involved in cell wall biosynthesis
VKRVLLVLQEETLGGASRALLRPVDLLRERGWEVSVWCSRPSPLYDDLVAMGYEVDGAPRLMRYRLESLRHPPGTRARLASLPRSLVAFRRALRRLDPDLVHVNGRLALPEALVARAARFPVATYIHDAPLSGVRGALGRAVPWLASNVVLCVCRTHAESLRLGRREPRVVFPGAPLPEAPSRALRPPGAPLVVGTIGVPSPRKGTDLFVDMAERLRDAPVAIELRLAGPLEDSPLAAWGRAEIRRGEAVGLRWLGKADVPAELRDWDVMVMPSRADPFPLAVLEAMGAAVAVVGADVDGIAEQLAEGAGVLVAPEDPDALTAAVSALAADPLRRAALGAAGRLRVAEHFTIEGSADALESAWREALATPTRRQKLRAPHPAP